MIYGWTPDYILDRLTVEDAVRFIAAGSRLMGGGRRPGLQPALSAAGPGNYPESPDSSARSAPDHELGTYQEPDRASFWKVATGN